MKASEKSQTDWQRLRNMTEEEIGAAAATDPDCLPLDDAFFATAHAMPSEMLLKETKGQATLRLDADVLEWFKCRHPKYQMAINNVLRQYIHAQRTL